MRFIRILVLSFMVLPILSQSVAASDKAYKLEKIASDLGVVWALDFMSPDQLIFTQRNGKVGLLNIETHRISELSGEPEVYHHGQGGLLDVAVPPDYVNGGWVYFTYSKPALPEAKTTLARAKVVDSALTDWQDLLITESASYRDIHFGSRIAFDGEGHLFFSIGDRGNRANAQDLTNHAGTIVRLNMDGSVPKDNPFVNDANALDEIWSYGHRNPQGLYFDHESRQLWEIEHGPRGGDEINLIVKGKNYGWPIVSQGKEYFSGQAVGVKHKTGMQEPVKVYIPSIAPSDLLLYRGLAFKSWQGDLLTGALKLHHLNRIRLDEGLQAVDEVRYFGALNQRIRSLAVDISGLLYIGTDAGNIYRMIPVN